MVNSNQKGRRGEYLARDLLEKHTKLVWKRVPASGAMSWQKGDLFVPEKKNLYCVEVKNYESAAVSENILTQLKSNVFLLWWNKTQRQADHMNQKPLLLFRHNRSKFFAAIDWCPKNTEYYLLVNWTKGYVLSAEELLTKEEIKFVDI